MKSTYKPLGNYIKQIKKKNTDGSVSVLKGIRINKEFMESVANIQGTDLSKYKVVEKYQFAYNPMHVGRDEILPISVLLEDKSIIVSPAYVVFEILDHKILVPEYLMMWCRRSEFDRNVWFTTDSSVRGGFSWESLCELEIPIPSIEKQRDIVKEYNTIVNRIKLNETLNQKLEDTAQALYKHWFVDFEFPNADGEKYKSSGGEMVYNEELDFEIPEGWELTSLGFLLKEKGYVRGPFGSALKKGDMIDNGVPVYEQQHAIDNHRNFRYFISKEKHQSLKRFTVMPNDLVISCSGTLGKIILIESNDPIGVINQALLILRPNENKIGPISFKYYLTSDIGNNLLVENSAGSAQVNIAKREVIQSIPFLLADQKTREILENHLSIFHKKNIILSKEIDLLMDAKNIILSKMSRVETKTEVG